MLLQAKPPATNLTKEKPMKKQISLALMTVLFSALASATSLVPETYELGCDGLRNTEGQRLMGSSQSLECSKISDEVLSCNLLSKAVVPNATAKISLLKVTEQSATSAVLTDGSVTVVLSKTEMSASMFLKSGLFQLCK